MFCKDNTKINLLQSIMSSICGTLRLLLIHLTLYDRGGGGFKSPSLRVFCPHAFKFGATLLYVGDFS